MKHGSMNIDELIDFIAHEARRLREAAPAPPAGQDGTAPLQRRARRRPRGWRAPHVACCTRAPRSALVH